MGRSDPWRPRSGHGGWRSGSRTGWVVVFYDGLKPRGDFRRGNLADFYLRIPSRRLVPCRNERAFRSIDRLKNRACGWALDLNESHDFRDRRWWGQSLTAGGRWSGCASFGGFVRRLHCTFAAAHYIVTPVADDAATDLGEKSGSRRACSGTHPSFARFGVADSGVCQLGREAGRAWLRLLVPTGPRMSFRRWRGGLDVGALAIAPENYAKTPPPQKRAARGE